MVLSETCAAKVTEVEVRSTRLLNRHQPIPLARERGFGWTKREIRTAFEMVASWRGSISRADVTIDFR
jgi:hypothetical protein